MNAQTLRQAFSNGTLVRQSAVEARALTIEAKEAARQACKSIDDRIAQAARALAPFAPIKLKK